MKSYRERKREIARVGGRERERMRERERELVIKKEKGKKKEREMISETKKSTYEKN